MSRTPWFDAAGQPMPIIALKVYPHASVQSGLRQVKHSAYCFYRLFNLDNCAYFDARFLINLV
jgi:hypothetical protein